ncbi:MAG: tetratricopeptide repeat protein, partial [Promethearchaeota archaeon]
MVDLGKKFDKIIKDSNSLKSQKKYKEAISKLQEAKTIIREKIKNFDERKVQLKNLKDMVDKIHCSEIEDLIENGKKLKEQSQFDNAINELKNAKVLTSKIDDEALRKKELGKIENLIKQTELKILIEEGNNSINDKKFDQALEIFEKAKKKAKDIYGQDVENDDTLNIKEGIKNTYIENLNFQKELGQKAKDENNYDKAIEIYEEAIKFAKDLSEIEQIKNTISNFENEINEIYSKKITPIIQEGKNLIEQGKTEEGINKLKSCFNIIEKMYETEKKQEVLDKIGSVLNPILIERLNPILEEGKEKIQNEDYRNSLPLINDLVNILTKAVNIVNDMADTKNKQEQLKIIGEIFNPVCSEGIKLRMNKGLELIENKNFEEAIGEMYSAMSIAKKMVGIEEENEEIQGIKNFVNKIYIAEIASIREKAEEFLNTKNYKEALDAYNKALNITNKMYLSKETENEIHELKNLIYQTELKKVIADGNIMAETQKFQEELNKLQEMLKNASLIKDSKSKEEKMEEIKRKIDDVHSKEVKFLIEQGINYAENNEFGKASDLINQTLNLIELIESPQVRDREKINIIEAIINIGNKSANNDKHDYAFMDYDKCLEIVELIENDQLKNEERVKIIDIYKNQLNNKARLELNKKQFDKCIEYCQKALKFDENLLESHFIIGNAYFNKALYDEAIDYFNKVIELDAQHI